MLAWTPWTRPASLLRSSAREAPTGHPTRVLPASRAKVLELRRSRDDRDQASRPALPSLLLPRLLPAAGAGAPAGVTRARQGVAVTDPDIFATPASGTSRSRSGQPDKRATYYCMWCRWPLADDGRTRVEDLRPLEK